MTNVFLADDQGLVRGGFRMLIEAEDDLAVVGEAADGAAAVKQLLARPADVVLMDIRMPIMDGVEATRRLVTAGVPTRTPLATAGQQWLEEFDSHFETEIGGWSAAIAAALKRSEKG